MALIEFHGNAASDHALHWVGAGASAYTHRGGAAYGTPWTIPNSSTMSRAYTPMTKVFMGWAWTSANFTSISMSLCSDSNVTQQITVVQTSSAITIRRGNAGGAVLGTFNFTSIPTLWYHIQVEAVIDDSAGVVKVRLNDQEVLTYSGDTKFGTGNSTIDGVWFSQSGNSSGSVCDYWICDDTGSAPFNTYLGDLRVTKHRPSAAGTTTQFTPDSGSNYARVNEAPYSAVNYVSSVTSGHKDTYAMDDLPASISTVYALKVSAVAKNPDGGTPQLRTVVRTNSTDYANATYTNLGGSDSVITNIWTQNPNTSASWTPTQVNAMEAGMQRA